ncbi:MAG: molybdopterin-dependent oxidoreductase [Fimbriimonadaceae bacterium]
MKRLSRRGFLWGALAVAFGFETVHYLDTRNQEGELPWPFRRALRLNEDLAGDYLANTSLAREFPRWQAEMPIDNGDEGLSDGFDPATWTLSVVGGVKDDLTVSLAQIKALPNVDMVTELRCIEGWSKIVHWTGCRLRDFVAKYPPSMSSPIDLADLTTLPPYVGLDTPDGGYYVGLDMASALHPQTLLCWAMNGQPLKLEHGAPLRLVIPVKYGIKNLKRIGTLTYSTTRPHDYWAESGYDWFAGL